MEVGVAFSMVDVVRVDVSVLYPHCDYTDTERERAAANQEKYGNNYKNDSKRLGYNIYKNIESMLCQQLRYV